MPVVRVDDEVYQVLKDIAAREKKPFTSPNNVVRFALGIDKEITEGKVSRRQSGRG